MHINIERCISIHIYTHKHTSKGVLFGKRYETGGLGGEARASRDEMIWFKYRMCLNKMLL